MCKYCKNIVNKPIRSVNWEGNGQINVTKTGKLYGKDDEVFMINYCPMCGRKLGDNNVNGMGIKRKRMG